MGRRVLIIAFMASTHSLFVLGFGPDPHSRLSSSSHPQIQPNLDYGKLPLVFESNQGQADPQVRFLARGRGYSLFLTPAEAVFVLKRDLANKTNHLRFGSKLPDTPSRKPEVLRLRLSGGNRKALFQGLEETGGKSNYFIGANAARWHENITQYAQVMMKEAYPGIDMVYYGNQRRLEYDFVVKPGADPGSIGLSDEGAQVVKVTSQGNLVFKMKEGDVVFQAPIAYQAAGKERKKVACRYVMRSGGRIGFEVEGYDRSKTLVIDPVLVYSSFLGGSDTEMGYGIAADAAGNAYVTGDTLSTNFPTTTGAFQTTLTGSVSAFITKVNPTGTALVYSTFLNGTGVGTIPFAIAVDAGGNAYVTGTTSSVNFPTTAGAYQTLLRSIGGNAFITKLNPAGSGLVYSTLLGGTGSGIDVFDTGSGITVDGAGNAHVAGSTKTTGFPTTPGAYQTVNLGTSNCFVVELNPTGTGLVYSTLLGGSKSDSALGIALDAGGNAYITGSTTSPNFPTSPGAYQTLLTAGVNESNAFISKVVPGGTGLAYSTYLGGSGDDQGRGIAVDGSGNAYVAGSTNSVNFPTTPGAFQTVPVGTGNAFVTKLNPTGTGLVYSTYLGGSPSNGAYGIALDAAGEAFVTGLTFSSNFPTTAGAYQTTFPAGYVVFLSQLNTAGSGLIYSTLLGASGGNQGNAVALDPSTNVYLTGFTTSVNFPITAGAFDTVYGGNNLDGFVAKFSLITPTSTPGETPTVNPSSPCQNIFNVMRNLFSLQSGQGPLTILASLCEGGRFRMDIYNSAGEHIKNLNDTANQPSGSIQSVWDGKNTAGDEVASGIYIIRMVDPSGIHQARLAVVR